jgi:Zn-dependent protease
MPLLMYFSTAGAFSFGYAKPVPVRFGQLRNPKRDMIWVALAGPGANLVQAILWGILLVLCRAFEVSEAFAFLVCDAGVKWNVIMFVFNLFPLPPLDGGRILVGLLPGRQAMMLARVEPWGFFIVMALVIFGVVSTLWMQPLMHLTYLFLNMLLNPLAMLLH